MFLTGRAVVLTAVGAFAVLAIPAHATAWLWLAFTAALCMVDVTLAASPRAEVTRETTATVRLGETAHSVVTVRNPGRRLMRALIRDAWVPSAGAGPNRHQVVIPPGERRRVHTPLLPTRRGRRDADRVTLRCTGPLGLAGRQTSIAAPGAVLVLPPFSSRRLLPSRLARLREMDGRTAVLIRGQGTEFDSLRDYVSGDDVRSIDWRATARAGDVVVRTWRPERDRRLLVVVDTGRYSAVRLGEETRLDSQVEAALLLAALASHAGDRVDVVAVDTEMRARVAGQSGPRLMSALAATLATVEPTLAETDWTRVTAVVRETVSQRALVVLLTALEPASLGNGLLASAEALARDHTVVVASALDPTLGELLADRRDRGAVYRAAAAERAVLEREAAAVRLRHRVEVVEAPAGDLPGDLADTYLRLKRAGKL